MIETKNLVIKYQNNIILKDLNLKFDQQKIYCITGESGCGKSSLLNVLGLLNDNYEGDLIINQHKNINIYSKLGINTRVNVLSYLFQELALIENKTVFENLKIVSKDITQINQYLEIYKLTSVKDSKIITLSGGQKHRIAFIRLLLQDNNILLLDEPGNNLDDVNKQVLLDEIVKLKATKIIIIVSHDKKIIDIADEVIRL